MAVLTGVKIRFDTHNDDKNDSTWVSVFVKNRLNNSLTPDGNTDFISNWIALQRYRDPNDLRDGRQNPYLAYGIRLGDGETFDDPSSREFDLTLTSTTISSDQIVFPAVHIHILSDDDDRWIFDYTVTLTFDNHASFSFSSSTDGVTGIILDQDNRNYYGIGVENPLPPSLPQFPKAVTDSVLKRVTLEFSTHNDNKDWDTRLNVHIVNRVSEHVAQDLAIGLDLFHDEEFPDSGSTPVLYKKFSWSSDDGSLPSNSIRLADMVLPVVNIIIYPNGDDRWIFDYRVTFEFASPEDFAEKRLIYSSRTSGVILDQDNNKHSGVYQGSPFPTVSPPTAPPLTPQVVDHTGANKKIISLSFLRRKLEEFVNNRNGPDASGNPPMMKVLLGSAVPGNDALAESYFSMRPIAAGKNGPTVSYGNNPSSIGQLYGLEIGDTTLGNIKSDRLWTTIDVQQPAPIIVSVDFAPFNSSDQSGSLYVRGLGQVQILRFSITVRLTLDLSKTTTEFAATRTVVDVMSWVAELQSMHPTVDHFVESIPFYRYSGTFLHQPVDVVSPLSKNDLFVQQVITVELQTDGPSELDDYAKKKIRNQIYSALTDVDVITKVTKRDALNSQITSWLLGGIADDIQNIDQNNLVIEEISVQNANPELGIPEDTLIVSYTGPRNVFIPKAPVDWPTPGHPNPAHDFSPGTLANIDHIVVLTKENRSFDHVLGYLSLPVARGGMGRQDIDGLKGTESNTYKGTVFRPFELQHTRFTPGPPNDYESVQRAINGGRMDGFVRSQADSYGDGAASLVMGYYTGATVPQYDALARDFAIGHRWFASHPGSTFPNRFYELTGRPNLDPRGFWELDNSSVRMVFTPTIFDYLKDAVDPRTGAGVTWRYFEHAYCTLRFYEKYTFDHTHVVDMDDPVNGFFTCARTGQLPNVSFIDPHLVDYPPDSNCDEPPSDIANGQTLVQRVVEAVVASPAWNKTLLLITYDEHGGFYDHVPPSPAAKVSPELPITTRGVRVPAIVISPWVAAGSVFGHDGMSVPTPGSSGTRAARIERRAGPLDNFHFDHTSILKTIARRFLSDNPPYMGARYAAAHDLSEVIGNTLRQPQFLPYIRYRLEFLRSQMFLEVSQVNRAPGAELLQFPEVETVAQYFSFEDAGNGFVYIRSHVSNLYVTVQAPQLTNAALGSAVANEPPPAGPALSGPSIIQDRKYLPPHSAIVPVGAKRPELQRWMLSPVGITVLDRDLYVISSEAYPNLFMQPAESTQPSSPMTLSDAGAASGVIRIPPRTWRVTSPLINDAFMNTQMASP